ncbi:oxidoreductase OXR1 [Zalerion maritima]|uniref:Oxidoreductase OXR1 n=1 Tax=Zalerion maritima TaxID=339359 RepID=A0AAD5RP17_9PEZI|nr:oxidoreductase OXR1 [Zalerion maritima]
MAISPGISRPFRVFVAGGSYGGLAATVHLLDHCSGAKAKAAAVVAAAELQSPPPPQPAPERVPIEVTIVDERDGFYHLIGTPLAYASESFASKAWVKFKDIPALKGQNIHCLQGTVSSIDPVAKEATVIDSDTKRPSKHSYDFFVGATGLRREWPSTPRSTRRKNYIFEAENQITAMASAASHGGAVIVGGGAVGVEMAAELKMCMPSLPVTLVHSRDHLLSAEPLPDEFKEKTLELVKEVGVEVRLNSRLKSSKPVEVEQAGNEIVPASAGVELEFEDGSTMKAGEVVVAISKAHPSTSYLPAACLDSEQYALVTPGLSLQPETGVANVEDHFIAGDAARWTGIKRCGTAMYMGTFVANNIFRRIQRTMGKKEEDILKLLELAEIPPMIGVAVGKKGVSYWPGQGTVAGEEVMEQMFRDDLGFTICWNHMMLGISH